MQDNDDIEHQLFKLLRRTNAIHVQTSSGEIELTRAWVGETLGALADDDEQSARLRNTLQVFLSEKGSFKATAEKLTLHKNTVQYRVRKAEDVLGVHVDENRLQIELALLACRWLGVTVLRSGPHRV